MRKTSKVAYAIQKDEKKVKPKSKKSMHKLIVSYSKTLHPKNTVFVEYSQDNYKEIDKDEHRLTIGIDNIKLKTYSKEHTLQFISGNTTSEKIKVFNLPFYVHNVRTETYFYIILIFHKKKRKEKFMYLTSILRKRLVL